jgi:prepilin-type N-terminal cleavage/methylation domain-containing protein/prepilin-type processing-associated H-X9-DG protein
MTTPGQGRRSAERAFSLLEMIVAVSIAVILAALAIPAISTGAKKAQSAKCAGNLRQLFLGISNYAVDNQNAVPSVAPADLWHRKIWPYIKTDSTEALWPNTGAGAAAIYLCPAGHDLAFEGVSYAINENIFGKKMLSSSKIFLLMDFNTYKAAGTQPNLDARLQGRHSGADNFLFQDGHIEPRKRSDVPSREQDAAAWGNL